MYTKKKKYFTFKYQNTKEIENQFNSIVLMKKMYNYNIIN